MKLSLLPPWVAPVAALALAAGAYVWGRSDGRALERSAALSETVKATERNLVEAGKQLQRDQAIERDRAESMAQLTGAVVTLLSQPPRTVTKYVEVPTHGQATVRCPAGVSAEFVRDWSAAADAADPPG